MALTAEEQSLLNYISNNYTAKYIAQLIQRRNDQTIKRDILKAKGKANKMLDKDIKDLNNMIKHASDNTKQMELLKKDSRVEKIEAYEKKMSITTKDIKGKGSYKINLDFGRFYPLLGLYPSYDVKGGHHPMIKRGRVHICSHEERLNRYMKRGDFYRSALILISLLYDNALRDDRKEVYF